MASGSSGRANSPGSKGFDFASDDILCSYEDYGTQDSPNGTLSDSIIGSANSTRQDFQRSRMLRSSALPVTNVYSQPEDTFNQEVISAVERSMKKHFDNLMRFLEGVSSRVSQLELLCYNVDKSIGEIRSDLLRDHGEVDKKLKSLDKHLQEVHRSVQILRDKQELAETQKELTKLQLAQKESSSEEKTTTPKKADDASEAHKQQLALALPQQVVPQGPEPSRQVEQQQSVVPLSQPPHYIPSAQLPNPQTQTSVPQNPYAPTDSPYRAPPVAFQQAQSQVNQVLPAQAFPQYPQQWPQQAPTPVQPPQQPPIQPQNQARPPPSAAYPPYMTSQPANTPPHEILHTVLHQSSGMPQPVVGHAEPMPYGGYGGAGRPAPPQPQPQPQPQPSHFKGGFPARPLDGYASSFVPSGSAYMPYDNEGSRSQHPPQQPHFPPGSLPLQSPLPPAGAGLMVRNQNASTQYFRNHPHNELIDKLVSMGYRGNHVENVIQRLEESGQAVDFNAVLDRLNVTSSGGSRRGW
ncbi:hypothetical protein Dimus_019820 [Dionaea muscipula]